MGIQSSTSLLSAVRRLQHSKVPPPSSKYVVVGGGIVGLATARELLLRSISPVTVVEAEAELASHQTRRNSGVVHAGLYYPPGSLKAALCRQGLQLSTAYFEKKRIPYKKVGKLIVALEEAEKPALQKLFANATENAVPDIRYLDSQAAIRTIEPECAGVAAIHSPHTAIVDWALVARHFAEDVREMGGTVLLNSRVTAMRKGSSAKVELRVDEPGNGVPQTLIAENVITCAGAQADRVAQLLGGSRSPAIVPVRGEYLVVTNRQIAERVRGNIYPVPVSGQGTPFLGVHFTPTMDGELIVGPNAVLAFSRTGYSWSAIRSGDVADMMAYPGFWRLAVRFASFGMHEAYRSLVLNAAAAAARRYVPALTIHDFSRREAHKNGVRAQAVTLDGRLIDDFVFESVADGRVLHVRNAPSPAATSSLAIAHSIVERSLSPFAA